MKHLPEIVKPKGVGIPGLTAKLLKRDGKVCLYERTDNCYELFIVQVSPAVETFGKKYPEREVYPGNEDFGRTAWCYTHLDIALKRFDALVEKQNNQ